MRRKLGDWPRVVQLIEQGAGNDEELKRAYRHLGDYSAERGKWVKAVKYYQNAKLKSLSKNPFYMYYSIHDLIIHQ